jgi:hypothetical protein
MDQLEHPAVRKVIHTDPPQYRGHSYNNTFTWSGPSGVFDCIGQRPIGPAAIWCQSIPGSDGCHAVPLNLLTRVW